MLARSSSVATAAVIAAIGCFALFSASTTARAQGPSINVVNPSFETDGDFGAFPGYVAGNSPITGWTDSNDGRTGVNNGSQPFASGTNIPDFSHVGLIQQNVDTGTLSQTISGLVPGEQYWFQVFYGERQGGTPVLNVTYGGQTLVAATTLPTANDPNFQFINVPFTPTTSSAALTFANISGSGDNTALIDGISVVQRNANQVVIANPSFEGSQSNGVAGYSNAIAGWTTSGSTGINPLTNGSSPFGVGTPPDGNEVALLQAQGATPASLSQTLTSLIAGHEYELTFDAAGRGGFDDPLMSVSVGAHSLAASVLLNNNNYQVFDYAFIADGTDSAPVLQFTSAGSDDHGFNDATMFLDNIQLADITPVPEPSCILLAGMAAIGAVVAGRRRRSISRSSVNSTS
jgi:hypothetical protein